jgi:two-component system sensor histidine kinase KdpD
VIDGLAYDNPPGARNPTRWQDVRDIVAAGIKVIGSINIQYITELRPDVEAITGKKVRETVPVSFIQTADEIEIVDAPAEGQAEGERNERLAKLRELALVLAADVVDHQLTDYLERSGIRQTFGANERILVCITPRANAREMIDTARTISQKFHGELIVTYVHQPEISPEDKTALEEKIAIAKDAGAAIEVLEGDDPADAILSYARSKGVTQLFVGHSQRSGLLARLFGNPVDKLIRGSHGMDVRIFPQ